MAAAGQTITCNLRNFTQKMLYKEPPNNLQNIRAAKERMGALYHTHALSPNQCTSIVMEVIHAPLPLVWSMVRKFDYPQAYKRFIKSCDLSSGNGGAGSIRELTVVSGLPAAKSTERLDRLDDDLHVMVVSIVGGDHRLVNYKSTTTLHEDDSKDGHGGGRTVVMESYVVDIPAGNCEDDTRVFADTIIKCNLKSLAKITEKIASGVA
ncbi:hypothetical protein CDL12_18636 [Handroanthus impetiginosus]|uniref:Uncharacterized protein n=1 Tax=Handroanthus impetiginosus TaxID=429701 RepID=A0A2G9GU20_9LAMI|nr:hypothetical protein CDL12_18636 [Handroanthus impetiginosus]